jgi:hypothetical protein
MQQEKLFRLAYEAIALNAHYCHGEGWRLVVTARRQDETWDEAHQATYDRLTTDELADVICVEASDRLRES